jgi:hypothetical protein
MINLIKSLVSYIPNFATTRGLFTIVFFALIQS